jgi:hypothetical protein
MERDELLRAAWKVMVAEEIDARRLVFLKTRWAPTPRFLLCTPGLRRDGGLTARYPATEETQHDLMLSSLSVEGLGPSLAVEGPTNREVFETYVERLLASRLRRALR